MATNDDMDARLERVETKVDRLEAKVDGLGQKVDGLEKKVDQFPTSLATFADDIKSHVGLMLDDAKETVQKAAEGYGATLERIERDLGAMNKKMDTKFQDHATLLKDHDRRITTLEQR